MEMSRKEITMRKRQTLILSLLLVVFLLGGCAEKEVADIAEKETTKEAVEEAVENTAQDTDQEEVLQEKQEAELPDGTYTAGSILTTVCFMSVKPVTAREH